MKISFQLLIIILLNSINDSFGQITFQKGFSGIHSNELNSVQQTLDGGYILGMTNYDGSYGDICLIKTNNMGDTVWTKSYTGPSNDQCRSVKQTTDSGYIITGNTLSFGAGSYDFYLIKTNSIGDTLWTKTYGGTTDELYDNSVQQTNDGGYIIAGTNENASSDQIYLIKTNDIGDTLWSKVLSGNGNWIISFSAQQTSDNGYVITGWYYPNGGPAAFLIKTNSQGNLLWSKILSNGSHDLIANYVEQTSDGGLILGGTSGTLGIYLAKTNGQGNVLWTKVFNAIGDVMAISVHQTKDNGYIISGWMDSTLMNNSHPVLIKTDSSGNLQWSKNYFAESQSNIEVQQTADTGYIIAGGTTSSFNSGGGDGYLIKTDSLGNTGLGCNNFIQAITTDTMTTIVSNGGVSEFSFRPVVGYAPFIVGNVNLVSTYCTPTRINDELEEFANQISVYPNPSSGDFTISIDTKIGNGKLSFYNLLGVNIFERILIDNSSEGIQVKNISPGIYFIKMFNGEKQFIKKIIIQ